MTIRFTVPGVPQGKGRPRVTSHGTYTPERTREYEELIRLCWRTQSGQSFAGKVPLLARVTAYFPVPKHLSRRRAAALEGAWHTSRPDADNIAKAILDALNAHAYPDDAAVQLDRSYKLYTNGAARVEVEILPADRPGEEVTP